MNPDRILPARRVYHDWDDVSTSPDYKLDAAFEQTNPGGSEEVTLTDWLVPISLLVGGFFLGRWWAKRNSVTVVGSGFDLLGAN